jgi:hypothetical protein
MYCRYDDDGEGGTKSLEFVNMSDEDKSQVLFECEMARESADDEMLAKMDECLGCLADCSSADSCLQGAASCPEPEPSDEG